MIGIFDNESYNVWKLQSQEEQGETPETEATSEESGEEGEGEVSEE